jgi:transcriptional regulator with XRE-family HTH domain
MKFRTAIGKVIRETRIEKSMTLRKLGEKSSVTLAHISDVERGNKEGSSEILECLADGLGVSLADLVIMAGWKMKIYNEGISALLELDLELKNL